MVRIFGFSTLLVLYRLRNYIVVRVVRMDREAFRAQVYGIQLSRTVGS